jgi:hypothetical protein
VASVVSFAFCAKQSSIQPNLQAKNKAADQILPLHLFCWGNYAAQGIAFLAQTLLGYFC